MEHWFDNATKALAGGVRRRGVLSSLALAPIASLLPQKSWAQSVLGKTSPPAPAALGFCTRTTVDGKRITTVAASTKYKGQLLTLSSTSTKLGRGSAPQTSIQRVELDSSLLYELTYNFVPAFQRTSAHKISRAAVPLGRLEITFSPLIRGPRHLVLKVAKGVIQGFADGHPVRNKNSALITIDLISRSRCKTSSQPRAVIWISAKPSPGTCLISMSANNARTTVTSNRLHAGLS